MEHFKTLEQTFQMRIFKWSHTYTHTKNPDTHTHTGKVNIITYQEKLQMKARMHTTTQLLRMNDIVLKRLSTSSLA